MLKINQKGFSPVIVILIAVIVLAVAGTGFLVWHKHSKDAQASKPTCDVTPAMKASNFYDVPCSLLVTVKGSVSRAEMEKIIAPIHGTIDLSLPETGIYGIKVPAGTDAQAIKYLREQPQISNVAHDHCCAVAN